MNGKPDNQAPRCRGAFLWVEPKPANDAFPGAKSSSSTAVPDPCPSGVPETLVMGFNVQMSKMAGFTH